MLAACSSSADKAARAANDYQAALARGDITAARDAMLRAVRADDNNAAYWATLGQLQLNLKRFSDAYYAFTRAVELDQTNVQAVEALAAVSLASGRDEDAVKYSDQLLLLQPDSMVPFVTKGFVALHRGQSDAAIASADKALATTPSDVSAHLLKARALDQRGDYRSAVAVLEQQLATGLGSDALAVLLQVYTHAGDIRGIMRTRARMMQLDPKDAANILAYAQLLYTTGQNAAARSVTLRLAQGAGGDVLAAVLALWLQYEPGDAALADARRLVAGATPGARLDLARFFIESGAPAEGAALVRDQATTPVTVRSANATAILAHALDAMGQRDQALALFDAVLDFDSANVLALRGRTDLYLALGRGNEALADAQKLVVASPKSPSDRLRLVRSYSVKGVPELATRALWEGFQDIPASPALHQALRNDVASRNGHDELASVDQQYKEQLRKLGQR